MSAAMAWARKGDAITATRYEPDGGGVWSPMESAAVNVTSTSTIRDLKPTKTWYGDSFPGIPFEGNLPDRDDVPTRQLMFGVDAFTVSAMFASGFGAAPQELPFLEDPGEEEDWAARLSNHVNVWRWLCWIESDDPEGFFDLANANHTDPDAVRPFNETRVPSFREADLTEGRGFDLEDVSYTSGRATRAGGHEGEPSIAVVYKDPFVVLVPRSGAAGWWMLLSRYRTGYTGSESVPDITPATSLGDIVAFWAPIDDPEFRSEQVVGPFRLVGCAACVTDAAGAVVDDIRFWLGTAGAAVVSREMSGDALDHLYVYYVVETCTAYLAEESDEGDMEDLVKAQGIEQGVWLKKIPLWLLEDALLHHADHTDEAAWSDLQEDPVVGGTIAGRVRVWTVADRSLGGDGFDIESRYVTPDGDSVFWADPAPVVRDGLLALFLAAIVPDDLEGGFAESEPPVPYLATWATVAVSADSVVDTYGLEFTVRDGSGGGDDDRIATTGTTTQLYLDPDPVRPLGARSTWHVYIGQDSGQQPLGLYEADESEIFRAWDAL